MASPNYVSMQLSAEFRDLLRKGQFSVQAQIQQRVTLDEVARAWAAVAALHPEDVRTAILKMREDATNRDQSAD